ncbi:DUF2332 domain-containing protein [Nocardia caishijiensis]|uniref:Uncharacterized protein DUF2332 n=1 Tax=Nocardia caishijiensis TaxID=184756 RepID=A0ABQ6YJ82_9NOCA|nr:DUF2332 domain-containing protein [Nocardia caishijiensis]KAF0845845.1 uncharacterized protein DUF2332 [Nocardia caishijiensis]
MDLAQRFRDFAVREVDDNSPLYYRRALAIAEDSSVLALLSRLPVDRQQPNLVLAAARLNGANATSYREFRTQLIERWSVIEATARSHRTQTNEVGRAATLLPVLAGLRGPLALIEVGASAGLCLYPDRFSYRYGTTMLDPSDGESRVLLPCAVTGAVPLPAALPEVIYRAGVDLNPLDVTDQHSRDWLEALVWPGQEERVTRLRAACEIVAADPPILVSGDLNERVAELVRAAPADSTVVVFHSAVLTYLSPEARQQFRTTVRSLPCHWISQEGSNVLPWLSGQLPARDTERARMVVALDEVAVAFADPHGRSLGWFASV